MCVRVCVCHLYLCVHFANVVFSKILNKFSRWIIWILHGDEVILFLSHSILFLLFCSKKLLLCYNSYGGNWNFSNGPTYLHQSKSPQFSFWFLWDTVDSVDPWTLDCKCAFPQTVRVSLLGCWSHIRKIEDNFFCYCSWVLNDSALKLKPPLAGICSAVTELRG